MDPIGTITCYFPFIEEETKNLLETIMGAASDYYDFVHRLGELVLEKESPVMVVYFAIHHSILSLNYKLIDKIREKYGHHLVLGPNLFISSAYQGTVEDLQKVHELADAVLATDPPDWLTLEMTFMKFEADMRNYPTTIYQDSVLNTIRRMIDENPDFGYYDACLYDYLAIRAHADGDSEERMRCVNKALRAAEKFDEQVRIAHLLIRKAGIIMNSDRDESRALLERAYKIVETKLCIPVEYAEIIYGLGVLDAIRGDFDSAIKRLLDVVSLRERAGLNTGNASYLLSVLHNVIGDFESGLEWACMAEEQYKSRPYLLNRAILNQAWSLILLKRLTEAQVLVDTTRESVLKSGDESHLAWLHFVTGLIEAENENFSLATSSVEQALRIYERQGTAFLTELIFLHQLARIEVRSCHSDEIVSTSLAILEDRAISGNLSGFIGQVLVLKGEMAIMTGDEALLRDVTNQLQVLADNENLPFLKPHFERLIRNL
ncbi:MAG: hypothetical protein ACFFE6_02605 [Candidatus Thorarchaeota archaeon]